MYTHNCQQFVDSAGVVDGSHPVDVHNGMVPRQHIASSHKLMQNCAFDIVLVEVPGLVDAHEALEHLAWWLKVKFVDDKPPFIGLIYIHDITKPRITYSKDKYDPMFFEVLGKEWFKQIVVVSNMWSKLEEQDFHQQLANEALLEGHWIQDYLWITNHASLRQESKDQVQKLEHSTAKKRARDDTPPSNGPVANQSSTQCGLGRIAQLPY
ncbi:hypothetical protein JAAARDRAFT_49996 [Jaapia argillacea MUCL 33604]|uniref:Uncharacterized protein n=1 Tax=Jaapia argillacea MUCL 33604 TaxID=933084 RepID=A0A067PE20_9AGAM|nr:hypothetical protein JAAARDRAFT_49996 [Jaapia argillacea MUCL 33604]